MIEIDGIKFNAEWVANSLQQTADIINGDGSGRLQGSKSMYLEYVGTFFNHVGQIHRSKNCTNEEWNSLFRTLCNPRNKHVMSFPFDDGILKQEVYIAKIVRKLIQIPNTNKWEPVYELTLPAVNAAWLVDKRLGGYTPYDNG